MGKNLGFYSTRILFIETLPCSPWAMLATWLHLGAPQEAQEIDITTHFEH
jgi:hypothetical protein